MSHSPQFDAFLQEVASEVRSRSRISKRQVEGLIAECAAHLDDLAHDIGRDHTDEWCEHEVLRRFGSPAHIAEQWLESLEGGTPSGRLAHYISCRPPIWSVKPHGLGWPVASAVGLIVGIGVAVSARPWFEALLHMVLFLPAVGVVIGVIMGAGQGVVLTRRLTFVMAWSLASGLGMSVGLTLGTVLVEALGLTHSRPIEDIVALALIGSAIGLATGLAQSRALLSKREFRRWWIAANTAGMGLGLGAGSAVAFMLVGNIHTVAGFLVLIAIGGLVSGSTTGWTLRNAWS